MWPTRVMRQSTNAALLIAISAFLWGTSFPVIKVSLGGAQDQVDFSFVISFLRLSLAAVLGIITLAFIGKLDKRLFKEPLIWLLGAFNAISFALQHLGLVYTTASKTALLVNFNVVFVAILAFLFFHERLRSRRVLGVTLGFGGVVIVATRIDPNFFLHGELVGDMLVLLAGFFWSLFILYTKKAIDKGTDYLNLSVVVLATTAIFLALPLPFINYSQTVGFEGWGGIVYLGAVSTLVPFILWSRALKILSATVSSVLLLLEVLFAVLLSIFFLGEIFLPVYILGGILILAGGVLSMSTEDVTPST